MDEQVDEWIKCLLTPKKDVYGERTHAAKELASSLLNVNAFNALYSVCAYPDVFALEGGLLKIAGESAGTILSLRDLSQDPKTYRKLDPHYFDGFHPEALNGALSVLTEEQKESLYEYTIENPQCSEALSSVFYAWAVERSLHYQGKDPARAMRNAANAIRLFMRISSDERNLRRHFDNIAMHVIAGEPNMVILSLFYYLIKAMQALNPPESDFQDYEFLHIEVLVKFVCVQFDTLQKRVADLKEKILTKYPEDMEMLETLVLMFKGDFREAYRACERLKGHERVRHEEAADPSFYQAWYLVVNWFIKERIF